MNMTELEEAYDWLRREPRITDEVPEYHKWYITQLLHDLDKRLTELSQRQDPHYHNRKGD